MKKSMMIAALCGFALICGSGAALADASSLREEMPVGSSEQKKARFAWEENLMRQDAARSLIQERMTGIPYGVDILGQSPSDAPW